MIELSLFRSHPLLDFYDVLCHEAAHKLHPDISIGTKPGIQQLTQAAWMDHISPILHALCGLPTCLQAEFKVLGKIFKAPIWSGYGCLLFLVCSRTLSGLALRGLLHHEQGLRSNGADLVEFSPPGAQLASKQRSACQFSFWWQL